MATELLQNPIKSSYEVSGPAAGVMADQQYLYWQEAQERAQRDQDLANRQKQFEFDQSQLDAPVKAAQRDLDLATKKGDLANLPAKQEEALAKHIQGKTEAQLKDADGKAEFIFRSSQQFPPDLFKDPAKVGMSKRLWDEQREEARKLGIKMPEAFTPESLLEWQRKGQQSDTYIKHRQKMEGEAAKEAAHLTRTEKEIAGRKDVAEIMAGLGKEKAAMGGTEATKIVNEINADIKEGKPVDIRKAALVFSLLKPEDVASFKDSRTTDVQKMGYDHVYRKRKAAEVGLDPEKASANEIGDALFYIKLKQGAKEYARDRWPNAKFSDEVSKSETPTSTPTPSTPAPTQSGASQRRADDKEITNDVIKRYGLPLDVKKYTYEWRTDPSTGRRVVAAVPK